MQEETAISADLYKFRYDLNFYFNAKNIPNQNLVFATYNYFVDGDGKKLFGALDFLNLFYWTYQFLNVNVEKPFDIINHLRNLPLNIVEKHILIAFILKWFGGYPVDNLNSQYNTTLKLIESMYLSNLRASRTGRNDDNIVNSEVDILKNNRDLIETLDEIITNNLKKDFTKKNELLSAENLQNKDDTNKINNSAIKGEEEKKYFFLSHSSKDAVIIKEFTNKILQLVLGLKSEEIFCTSIEEFSITSGEDFRTVIKEELLKASHVIQFITKNYKESEVCLNEMGAAWVLNTKVKPFILDPVNYNSVGFIHSTNQQLKFDEKKDLLKFVDELKHIVTTKVSLLETNRHIESFLEIINSQKQKLSFDKPSALSPIPNNLQDQSEIIFFNLNSTKDYYLNATGEYNWENNKPIGEKGSGNWQFKNNIINIDRFNTQGRFIIRFLRYSNLNIIKEYIESNVYNNSTRIICFEFEAKVTSGKHWLWLVAKQVNATDWIHNANTKVMVYTTSWCKFKKYIYVPATENFTILLDDRELDQSPSSIQIKDLVIKEVF